MKGWCAAHNNCDTVAVASTGTTYCKHIPVRLSTAAVTEAHALCSSLAPLPAAMQRQGQVQVLTRRKLMVCRPVAKNGESSIVTVDE